MGCVCDFCNDPEPTWIYPAQEFVAAEFLAPDGAMLSEVSTRDWLSCDACSEMVDAREWSKLYARVAPTLSPPPTPKLRESLILYWVRFNSRRWGPKRPITPEERKVWDVEADETRLINRLETEVFMEKHGKGTSRRREP